MNVLGLLFFLWLMWWIWSTAAAYVVIYITNSETSPEDADKTDYMASHVLFITFITFGFLTLTCLIAIIYDSVFGFNLFLYGLDEIQFKREERKKLSRTALKKAGLSMKEIDVIDWKDKSLRETLKQHALLGFLRK